MTEKAGNAQLENTEVKDLDKDFRPKENLSVWIKLGSRIKHAL